jgi:hypothetical protein
MGLAVPSLTRFHHDLRVHRFKSRQDDNTAEFLGKVIRGRDGQPVLPQGLLLQTVCSGASAA